MSRDVKRTPLHAWHLEQGANMAIFSGYDMPLWYASVQNEHLAVLRQAGLFDTSHMAVIAVSGPGAFDLLQKCFSNNLAGCIGPKALPLSTGRCVYGAFLDHSGGVIDDAIVFKTGETRYWVVVNAGMGAVVAAHMEKERSEQAAVVQDLTDQVGKVDLQGPLAPKILRGVLEDPDAVMGRMPYFSFKGCFPEGMAGDSGVQLKGGIPVLVSRTGYTGEIGFEIFCHGDRTRHVWDLLLTEGQPLGLQPCGLAARDSLRAGAVLPLSHQDIGPWPFIRHPWPFALPFNADQSGFTKSFIGDQALLNVSEADYTYAFVGKDLRKVSVGDPALVVDDAGNCMGQVLTCATDMGIGWLDDRLFSVASPQKPAGFHAKGVCCGFVKVDRPLPYQQEIVLKDKRRQIVVQICRDIRPDRTARRPLKDFLQGAL